MSSGTLFLSPLVTFKIIIPTCFWHNLFAANINLIVNSLTVVGICRVQVNSATVVKIVTRIKVGRVNGNTTTDIKNVTSPQNGTLQLAVEDPASSVTWDSRMEYSSPGATPFWILTTMVSLAYVMNLSGMLVNGQHHDIRHGRHYRRQAGARRYYGEYRMSSLLSVLVFMLGVL